MDSPEEAARKIRAIVTSTPDAVAVRFADKTLSIHQLLAIYSGLPAPRPEVQTQAGFIALIKPLITPELMAQEAVRCGIAAECEFQQKLVQNQNALLRFHVHGAIEAHANDVLRGPNLEATLQAWYRDHADLYAVTTPDGTKTTPSFAAARDRVLGDFSVDLCERLTAEKIRELRARVHVTIDEAALSRL